MWPLPESRPQRQAGFPACGTLQLQLREARAWCGDPLSVRGVASPVWLTGRALPERFALLVDLEVRALPMLDDRFGG
jgi:hypothetical protein